MPKHTLHLMRRTEHTAEIEVEADTQDELDNIVVSIENGSYDLGRVDWELDDENVEVEAVDEDFPEEDEDE